MKPQSPVRKQGGLLRLGRIEHGVQVVDQCFDGRDVGGGESLRAAKAAPVRDDEASEAGELTQKTGEPWMLPVEDDIREHALEVDEIVGAVADDLIRESVVAIPRITDIGSSHAPIVAHTPIGGKS